VQDEIGAHQSVCVVVVVMLMEGRRQAAPTLNVPDHVEHSQRKAGSLNSAKSP
jgi:hypothetical protein